MSESATKMHKCEYTIMTGSCERCLDLFKRPCDRRMRDADTVIPHNRKAKFATIVPIFELVFVFVPFLAHGQWVFDPGFRFDDRFHKRLESRDAAGDRAKDR